MNNIKNEKGITLIALVVTIVVLLILAGITIAFVLSDGGIFQSAQDAKIEQMRATIMDYAVQINPTVTARYYANGAKGEILLSNDYETDSKKNKEELNEEIGWGNIVEVIDLSSFFPGYDVIRVEDSWDLMCQEGKLCESGFYVVNENIEGLMSDALDGVDEDKIFSVIFDYNGNVTVENGMSENMPKMQDE